MPNYRRRYGEGGTFAFTVCLADRRQRTLIDEIDLLRDAWCRCHAERPFDTLACAVMPDHLHAVWRLPEGDTDYSGRWQAIKGRFTAALGRRVWQPRFWESAVRDDAHLTALVNYVHFNPVKHGHARDMDDWPHSTWHRWKRENTWSPPPADMHL